MDRQHWPFLAVGSGLWTLAIGLAIYATGQESWAAALWAIMTAQGACLATGLIIADLALLRQAMRTEEIAEIAAREVIAHCNEVLTPFRQHH